MIEFRDYIEQKIKENPSLKDTLWDGYEDFKVGVLLKEARKNAGLTQEHIAGKLKTTKSVISRIENHAEDIRLSTLEKFAKAMGKELRVTIS